MAYGNGHPGRESPYGPASPTGPANPPYRPHPPYAGQAPQRPPGSDPPSARPRRANQIPYAIAWAGVLIGLVVVALGQFRNGEVVVGATAFAAAAARLLLPEPRVGLLAVRRRWFDVTVLFLAGVTILVVAVEVPG